MTRLKTTFAVVLWLSAGSLSSTAQIRELWHRDFTHVYPDWGVVGGSSFVTNYVAIIVKVDRLGNTLVAGSVNSLNRGPESGPTLAKITPSGELAWMFVAPSVGDAGVQTLALSESGIAFFGAPLFMSPSNGYALIAVDADGAELWRKVDNGSLGVRPSSSLKLDTAGNVLWLHLRLTMKDETPGSELLVSKYTPQGQLLWELALPDGRYGLPWHGLANALCLGPDGSSFVTGGYRANEDEFGFVAKVSPHGELKWFRQPAVPDDPSVVEFSTVALAGNGNVCAAGGHGYAVLTGDGELVRFGTYSLSGEIISTTREGGFVMNQHAGADHLCLSQDGRVVWRTPIGTPSYLPDLGTVGDGVGGWLTLKTTSTGGGYGAALVHVDAAGTRLWLAPITNRRTLDPWDFLEYRLESVARAPDGT
ncbi:MAG: hypothetical protein WCO84_08225 [bacterium]